MFYTPIALLLVSLTVTSGVADVEDKALAQRRSIRTLDIQYEVTEYDAGRDLRTRKTVRIWIDGVKTRGDYQTAFPGNDASSYATGRFIRCKNCERPGWGIDADDHPDMGIIIAPLNSEKFNAGRGLIIEDPRVFGYSSNIYGLSHLDPLDKSVGSTHRTNPTISQNVLNGVDCVHVSADAPRGHHINIWYAPKFGHSIAQIQYIARRNNAEAVTSTVTSYDFRLVGQSGLYYPNRIVWKRTDHHGQLLYSDELQVQSIKINEPIPSSTFTLAGLNLPDGKYVLHDDQSKSGNLLNGMARPLIAPEMSNTPPPIPVDAAGVPIVARTNAWWYAAVALALAAVAVAIYCVKRA